MTENENAVNWADTPEYKLLDSIRAEAGLEQVSDVVERTKLVPEKAVMLAAQKQEFPLETWNKALERIAGSAYSPADTVIDAQLMMMDFLKHPKKKKTEMSFLKKPAKVNAEVDDKSREADETTEGEALNPKPCGTAHFPDLTDVERLGCIILRLPDDEVFPRIGEWNPGREDADRLPHAPTELRLLCDDVRRWGHPLLKVDVDGLSLETLECELSHIVRSFRRCNSMVFPLRVETTLRGLTFMRR